MTKTILVTSCKGGVGKSTVIANLSAALSALGAKVLLIDMDLGNRSLDLILGCEDKVVYDVSDVCCGRVTLNEAVIPMPEPRSFLFCPAPFFYGGGITKENFASVTEQAKALYSPDFILLDTSGGADISVELCAAVSDEALVVSSRNPTSLRAAGKSASLLDSFGVTVRHLVINGYDLYEKTKGDRAGVLDMIDLTGIPVIGIIPQDADMAMRQEKGKLCNEGKYGTAAAAAFRNTARRMLGEKVNLLCGVCGIGRRQRRHILLSK